MIDESDNVVKNDEHVDIKLGQVLKDQRIIGYGNRGSPIFKTPTGRVVFVNEAPDGVEVGDRVDVKCTRVFDTCALPTSFLQ